MNWQTISTAPKDGTRVLLGRFVKNCAHGHDGGIRVDWWHSARRGDEYEGFGHFNTVMWPPTHWMPLPPPPKD